MLDWQKAFDERYEYGFSDFDERTGDILNFHAMLERELDLFIAKALPRAGRLHGLGFGHKIGIWAACLSLSDKLIDPVTKSLIRFNDLRNSVAHGDRREEVDKRLAKLVAVLPPAAKKEESTLDDIGGFPSPGYTPRTPSREKQKPHDRSGGSEAFACDAPLRITNCCSARQHTAPIGA